MLLLSQKQSVRDGPGPASNGTAKESCQLSVHTHTYIHVENPTYVVGIVHEEKSIPTLKAASVFTFFFFFPHRGKMICHWCIPRMRMGVTREGDGALTSTGVPMPPAQFPRG